MAWTPKASIRLTQGGSFGPCVARTPHKALGLAVGPTVGGYGGPGKRESLTRVRQCKTIGSRCLPGAAFMRGAAGGKLSRSRCQW